MDKPKLRETMLELRETIPKDRREAWDSVIYSRITENNKYRQCHKLFTYINMGSEVNTITLIEKALESGKIVAVPFVVPKSRIMHFLEIHSLDYLIKSKYGVWEPKFDETKISQCDNSTLLIVPGLAYDYDGYRIGYGGGYYDTYLETNPYGYKMGIAYSDMVVEKVPQLEHDKQLDALVTNKEVFVWKH